jgi:type IV pilus assembly protein PilV
MSLGAARVRRRSAGFSLVEVLVALVVCSVGLLGLAKMESLALSSTSLAGTRSVAAIEAASLAAMMHANPDFWQSPLAYPSTIFNKYSNPFPGAVACTVAGGNACTPAPLAQYDLSTWWASLNQVMPTYTAAVTCSATLPITCVITLNWGENAVAISTAQSNIAQVNAEGGSYSMYVQP